MTMTESLDLKRRFEKETALIKNPKHLVIAIQYPEYMDVVTNTENIPAKIEFYKMIFDDYFYLKPQGNGIKVIGFMIV